MKRILPLILFIATICQGVTSTTTTKVSFACDGTETTFACTGANKIICFDDDDFKVYLRLTSTGVETLQTRTTHYTVSATNNNYGNGFTIEMVTAPAATYTLHVKRDLTLTHDLNLRRGMPIPMEALERELDRLTLQIQDLQEQVDRSIKIPVTDSTSLTTEAVNSVSRASSYLAWGAGGGLTNTSGTTSDITTSVFMETFLDDADGNAGLTTLGGISVFNVETYGALGDGVTDDTAAIQAAIDACELTGGVIYFPTGIYYIDQGRLNYNSLKPVIFKGDGWGSKLDWNYATDVPAQNKGMLNICGTGDANASHCVQVLVMNLQVDGNGAGQDETTTENRRGINIYNSDNVHVINCEVHHMWGEGVGLGNFGTPGTAGTNAIVRDCYFHDNSQDDINPNVFNVVCTNNTHESGNNAIEAGRDYGCVITNSFFNDYDGPAIKIASIDQFVVYGNKFTECSLDNTGGTVGVINIAGQGRDAPAENGMIANNSIVNAATHANQVGISYARGTQTSDNTNIMIRGNIIQGIQQGIDGSSLVDSFIVGNLISDGNVGINIGNSVQVAGNRYIGNFCLDNTYDYNNAAVQTNLNYFWDNHATNGPYCPITTFGAADTTPSVFGNTRFGTGGALTLTDLDDGVTGQIVTIWIAHNTTWDTTTSNLGGSTVDLATTSGDMVTWMCLDGTNWRLVSFIDIDVNNN